MIETMKARTRREMEDFFSKYCIGKGLDIGAGNDPLLPDIAVIDLHFGTDVRTLPFSDNTFDFVYSSHCLEHLICVEEGIRESFRVLKPHGYMIYYLPHRDLYEHRISLSEPGNADHKHFFLMDRSEAPVTIGIIPLVATMYPNSELIYAKKCQENGEFSIECIWEKAEEKSYRKYANGPWMDH